MQRNKATKHTSMIMETRFERAELALYNSCVHTKLRLLQLSKYSFNRGLFISNHYHQLGLFLVDPIDWFAFFFNITHKRYKATTGRALVYAVKQCYLIHCIALTLCDCVFPWEAFTVMFICQWGAGIINPKMSVFLLYCKHTVFYINTNHFPQRSVVTFFSKTVIYSNIILC